MSLLEYTITDSPHTFSDRTERLKAEVFVRLKPNRVREGTFTGPEPTGITPFLDAFENNPEEPYPICLAKGIVSSWLQSPVIIRPDELIVGVPRPNLPLYEHFSWGIIYDESRLDADAYKPLKDEFIKRREKLKNRLTPLDWEHVAKEGIKKFGSKEVFESLHSSVWWVAGYQGHTCPDYEHLLINGIDGVLSEVRVARGKLNKNDSSESVKITLYSACEVVLKGFSDWILLYAEKAAKLAENEPNIEAKSRYLEIAQNCGLIAFSPPKTFAQAAQLLWFYSLWDWVDCLGRTDQYLYPFYNREDDKNNALDTLHDLWLKFLEHGVHNITLGGQTSDGEDATNCLSFLMLEASRTLRETHPRISIRIHDKMHPGLFSLAVKMWSEGMSDPTIVNDRIVIDGFVKYGVDIKEARTFTMTGCQEIEIPGKSNIGCEDGMMNLAKCLELAMNDGKDRFSGYQIGPQTGALTEFKSFKQLLAAYKTQVEYFVPHFVDLCNLGVEIRSANLAKLVKMPFTKDCIARGLDPDNGGPVYNFGMVETCGMAATADALTAVKVMVFDNKEVTLDELSEAIAADFKGYEILQQKLKSAPKFGNDNSEADDIAVNILTHFWTEIGKYNSARGGAFYGACSLLESGIYYGDNTWAMADGNPSGTPLGNSIGPRPGANINGLTAMLSSVAKLPLSMGIGGTTCNVSIPPEKLLTEKYRDNVNSLMKVYFDQGGLMAQISIVDAKKLRKAQKNPEQYNDLIVRVGGFSIRFVELSAQTQNEIIQRSETQ